MAMPSYPAKGRLAVGQRRGRIARVAGVDDCARQKLAQQIFE